MLFGERLQQQRKQLNLTQQDIATKFHVSRQTISSWERGNSYPDIDSLIMISNYYYVSLDILLKEDTGMKDYLKKTQVARSIKPILIMLLVIDVIFLIAMMLHITHVIRFNSLALIIVCILGILNALALIQISSFQRKLTDSTKQFPRPRVSLIIGVSCLVVRILLAVLTKQATADGILTGLGAVLIGLYFFKKTNTF